MSLFCYILEKYIVIIYMKYMKKECVDYGKNNTK